MYNRRVAKLRHAVDFNVVEREESARPQDKEVTSMTDQDRKGSATAGVLGKVDAMTSVELDGRWQSPTGDYQYAHYVVGGLVKVFLSYGPEGYAVKVVEEYRPLCASRQVELQAALRVLARDQGEKCLVYINSTGGTNDIDTSGDVLVLDIDWEAVEESGAVPDIPEVFFEAFPYLRSNLDTSVADIERRREAEVRAAEAAEREELLNELAGKFQMLSTEELREAMGYPLEYFIPARRIDKGEVPGTELYSLLPESVTKLSD